MNIGKLDRRIRVERPSLTNDDGFGRVETWRDLFSAWASKIDVSDAERWRADAVGATVTSRFRIRWRPAAESLTRSDRILCEGTTYEITGIKELGRRKGYEITAAAEVE